MAGKPVQVEFTVGDTKRATKFYGDLFGWQFQDYGGPTEYLMASSSEDSGVGVMPGDAKEVRVYFDVDDVQASRQRVEELGGSAEDAMPVPNMGWFARCTDTEGIPFGLWQTDPNAQMPQQ
jgi:uncharacterized protein